jgi:two-component system sensor histidine kinase/response regulator
MKESRVIIIDDMEGIHADITALFKSTKNSILDALRQDIFGPSSELSTSARDLNFEFHSAFQGEQGYELVKDSIEKGNPYSVAIVDMRMPPGWDGLQTIQKIREVDPNIEIIICSAYSDYSWREIAENLGVNSKHLFLSKPFEAIEMKQMVVNLAEKWNLNVENRKYIEELRAAHDTTEKYIRSIEEHKLDLQNKVNEKTNELSRQNSDILKIVDQLNLTSEKLNDAQKIANIGSWELDPSTNELTWSQEHFRIFELEDSHNSKELYQIHRKRIHPDDLPSIDRAIAQTINTGTSFSLECRIVFALDRIKFVLILGKMNSITLGAMPTLIGTTQDISARKIYENKLQENEKILRFALEGAGDGVWQWHIPSGKIHYSKRWKEMLGYAEDEIGDTLDEWMKRIKAEDLEAVKANLQAHQDGKSVYHNEHRIECKDGNFKWILGRGMVVDRSPEGLPILMVGTHADITRMKIAEAQLLQSTKRASLGDMSAGIAHEICNPLAVISAVTKILPKFSDSAENLAKKITIIDNAVTRITEIVNGLRKYSYHQIEMEFKAHSLSSMVNDAIVHSGVKSIQSDIRFILEIEADLSIDCDEVEIELAIMNLIKNSIEAVSKCQDKWVKIEVRDDSDRDYALLQIVDSGPGISEQNREKIFDPFFTTKHINEGIGLGLSTVKGILDKHKATIKLVTPHSNTCFELRFRKHP